jgi:hypothetical protein
LFSKEWVFLKAHEHLLIAVFVLLTSFFVVTKTLNYLDARDTKQAIISEQILAEQKAQNATLAQQLEQAKADDQANQEKAAAQINALQAGIQQIQNQLAKQKQSDQTMPLPSLLTRWEDLAGLSQGDLLATTGGVSVTESGARKTTEVLENVPALQKELDNEKQIVQNKDSQISSMSKVVGDQSNLITGLNSQIVKADTACKDEIAKVKADDRKKITKAALFGAIAGFALKAFGHF